MMKHLKTKGVIIALSLTFLIACGGSKTKKPPASLSVAPQVSVRVGESKTVPVTAQNTDFTVSADKTGSGCARADDKSIVCTPTATGEYHLTLTATANKSITARLTVNVSEPLTLSVAPQVNARVGESKTVPVTTQNTDFTVSADKVGSGCARADDKSIVCSPTASGEYHLTLTATVDASITAGLTVNVPEIEIDSDEALELFADDTESNEIIFNAASEWTADVKNSNGSVPSWIGLSAASGHVASQFTVKSAAVRATSISVPTVPHITDRSPSISGEKGTNYITVVLDPNYSKVPRTAIITITTAKNGQKTITVTQLPTTKDGIVLGDAVTISISPPEANTLPGEKRTFSVTAVHTDFTFSVVPSTGHGCDRIADTIACTPTAEGAYEIKVTALNNPSKIDTANLIAAYEYVADANIRVNLSLLGAKRVSEVRFDAKPSGFSSPQILQQISLLGDGVLSLTVGDLRAAISAISPAGSEVKIGRGNVSATPTRLELADNESLSDYSAYLKSPTINGVIYLFVIPPGSSLTSTTGTLMYVVAEVPKYEYIADTNIRVNLSMLGEKGISDVKFDAKPGGFASVQILRQISFLGGGIETLTAGELKAAIEVISPAGSEIKLGKGNVSAAPGSTRVELLDSESLSNYSAYLKNPTVNGVIYLFVIPPGSLITSTSGTVMYVVAEIIPQTDEYITDAANSIRVNISMLGAKGITAKFDTKPSGFTNTQIRQQISLQGDNVATLTAGELKAAIEAISPAGSEIKLGKGNVSAAPGSTRVELLDSESLSNYSAYLKNPTVNGVIYLFVIPPGSLITSTSGTAMYVVADVTPLPDEYITDAAASIRVNISRLGVKGITAKFDTKPSGFTSTQIRQQISLQGDNVATLTAGELKAAIEAISPAGSEIKLGKGNVYAAPGSTRVELQDNESLSNYSDNLENPTTGGVIYLFVIPPGSTLTSSTGTAMYVVARVYPAAPAPPITNGMLIAMASPVAGNTRAIVGDYIYKAGSGVPVLASAINPDTTYITYQTGVYRIKIDAGGNITDFWADYDVVDEGYIMRPVNTAAKTISLGINNPKAYGYNDDTKFFNLSTFAAVTKSAFETAFATEQIGYKYWAVDENKNGVLEALYYMPSSVVSAANRSALEKFKTVVPAGAMYSVQDPLSELKYAYYDPAKTAPGALVVFLPGSGAGYDVWQNMSLTPDILNWTNNDYQSAFGAGGAYIMVPSANVHPVIGMEYRWDNMDGSVTHTAQLERLIVDFIAAHNIDANRVYIGGVSVGGGMTMWMIQSRPDLFAAAFPISPTLRTLYSDKEGAARDTAIADALNAADLPVWLFMGEGDSLARPGGGTPTVNTAFALVFANALVGGSVVDSRYTVFEPALFGFNGAHGFPVIAVLKNLLSNPTTSYITGANTVLSANSAPLGTKFLEWLAVQERTGH